MNRRLAKVTAVLSVAATIVVFGWLRPIFDFFAGVLRNLRG